jgi:serine/threonine protein phosphatase PrpC
MEESQLKSFITKQLVDKLHKDNSSLDATVIATIVQQHKEQIVDFMKQFEEIKEESNRIFMQQQKFNVALSDFLESSYEDFKNNPLPKESEFTISSEPVKSEKQEPAIEQEPPKPVFDVEIVVDLLTDIQIVEEPKPTPSIPVPTQKIIPAITGSAPIRVPPVVTHPPKTTQDMRFGNQNQPRPQPPPPMKKLYFMNGEEDKAYHYKVDWQKLGLSNVGKHRFEGLEKYGLTYKDDMEFIEGKPTTTGELAFKFFYFEKDDFWKRKEIACQVLLFIKPDTRKMFDREIEPEAGLPYPKDHLDACLIQTSKKTLIGASRRGRSHAMDGRFRDDDMRLVYQRDSEWYIIAVADGAGSAKYARQGSLIACETAVSVIQKSGKLEDLDRFLVKNAENTDGTSRNNREGVKKSSELKSLMYSLLGQTALEAHKAISRESAMKAGSADKDYSTTLLISIAKKYDNHWFIGSYWVGDGGIGIYFEDRDPIIMGIPDSGEFSGQTRFLTMRDIFSDYDTIAKRLYVEFVPDFKALVLMTDGITDALFHTEANLLKKDVWDKFYTHLTNEVNLEKRDPSVSTELLAWINFWEKGEYDDRTIAILY